MHMNPRMTNIKSFPFLLMAAVYLLAPSCKKSADTKPATNDTIPVVNPPAFDINSISDTYDNLAAFSNYPKWGSYNVHDPSIKKFGDTYYCYSTDVGFGTSVPAGIQVRKSKDL